MEKILTFESLIKTIRFCNENKNGYGYSIICTVEKPVELYEQCKGGYNKHLITLITKSETKLEIGDRITVYYKDENITFEQKYKEWQIKTEKIKLHLIKSEQGVLNYFINFKGIGDIKAQKILTKYLNFGITSNNIIITFENHIKYKDAFLKEFFNDNSFNLIQTQIEKKLEIKNKETENELILTKTEDDFGKEFDISPNLLLKLKRRNNNVIQTVFESPFLPAINTSGVGFIKMEELAIKLREHAKKHHPHWVISDDNWQIQHVGTAIMYALYDAEKEGHVFVRKIGLEHFLSKYQFIKEYNPQIILLGIKWILDNGTLIIDKDQNGNSAQDKYYLKTNYENECFIAKEVSYKLKTSILTYNELLKKVKDDETKQAIIKLYDSNCSNMELSKLSFFDNKVLDDIQRQAIKDALLNHIFILSGGPGTGKTTISQFIHKFMIKLGLTVAIMAPTGTAARRISQVIKYPATTIHRGLKIRGLNYTSYHKYEKIEKGNVVPPNPFPYDVLLVDESSMLDQNLTKLIFLSLKQNAKIIFIGDTNQLPSVGAGNILFDFIKSGIPYIILKKVYRQQGNSGILTVAYGVNSKDKNCYLPYKQDKFDMSQNMGVIIKQSFYKRNNDEYKTNMVQELMLTAKEFYNLPGCDMFDTQILTQKRNNGITATLELNVILQKILNFDSEKIPESDYKIRNNLFGHFKLNDKVIQTNNYYVKEDKNGNPIGLNKENIFNGTLGTIQKYYKATNPISKKIETYVEISFLNGDTNTITKYTLSELSKNVELAYAITIHKSQGQEYKNVLMLIDDYMFATTKIIYTGITRSREKCFIFTNDMIFQKGIENEDNIKETIDVNGNPIKKSIPRNTFLSNRIKNEMLIN